MRDRRSVLGVIGVLACLLSAVLATGAPAQAATADDRPAARVLTLPAAPAAGAATRSAAAEPPTTWPKANRIVHQASGTTYTCDSGNLCLVAWDATKGDYAIFFLYYCDTYALSNFLGTGSYANAQTGGAAASFYGQSGNLLRTVAAGTQNTSFDWTPVWSVRNC